MHRKREKEEYDEYKLLISKNSMKWREPHNVKAQ